ncbi:MAG TPA: HAMP domain-containing sensor histidine kinase [Nocardioides sp.]|jgi:two-component system OmpR family sensor kinase|nr:HAMP domain-containing sensor histidine kinase [Nocardioides sp.]
MNRLRSAFASLTSRLVLTTVLLVAVVALLIATAATFALRTYLSDRLDRDVTSSLGRLPHDAGPGPYQPPNDHDQDNNPFDLSRTGLLSGALGTSSGSFARIPDDDGVLQPVSQALLAKLAALPADGRPHDITLPGYGEYRVALARTPQGTVLAGLPASSVDGPVSRLVLWEVLVGMLGIAAAAGAGTVLVRRQLRPLREVARTAHNVADLPLATGEIELAERVPERLTDERTEVGQVGSALNTLLAHVESSLHARHESEQQVRQFVADASHELRTPLTTIAGYTELARRRPDDPSTTRTALSKVEEESVRMTAMVEDLLLLARLDAGRPLERRPVDLSRLLVEAVSDARVVSPDHRWKLELPEDSIEVTGDVQRLHQVVTNLLGNARKYTPPGTTVTVTARPHGFSVHDDGPGFPPGLAEKAFERFARGDVSRTRGTQGGVGLGLALVQAIVTAHGGRVSLHSRPGSTEITVDLPA